MTVHAVDSHEGFPSHDAAISDWLAKQGWPVTIRLYDFDLDVLIWRAEGSTPRVTLRAYRTVCEDMTPEMLVAYFDDAKLAESLAEDPKDASIVRGEEVDSTVIVELVRAP